MERELIGAIRIWRTTDDNGKTGTHVEAGGESWTIKPEEAMIVALNLLSNATSIVEKYVHEEIMEEKKD